MKNTHLLTILFTLSASLCAMAQKTPCTLVTSSFDTLTGIFIKAEETFLFIQDYDKRRVSLRPEQVYEYALLQLDGTPIFYQYILHPKTGKRKPMRRLVDGYYKLYLHKEPTKSPVNPALPKNSSVPRLTSAYYLASYSEDAVELSPKNWERVLHKRLEDFPMLIENRMHNDFQFRQLPQIIASYNAFIRQQVTHPKKADTPVMEK